MKNQLINEERLKGLPKRLPGWEVKDKKLERKWLFKNFIEAFGFMTKVALLSESINHHPDWKNVYNTVTIELTSHDLGGISELDIYLANAIDELN